MTSSELEDSNTGPYSVLLCYNRKLLFPTPVLRYGRCCMEMGCIALVDQLFIRCHVADGSRF